MAFKSLILIRNFHTSRQLFKSLLSDNYRSHKLWDERRKCPHLSSNVDLINTINDKIIIGNELDNVELDVFINITSPSADDTAQIRESVVLVNKIRRSLYANTILPSTHHGLCRLFLYSDCLPSLVHVLENRVDYGIFPDLFAMNLLLDEALDKNNLVLGAKIASLIMLQEEFGLNPITDALAALSIIRYVNSKTDFNDWKEHQVTDDKILEPAETETTSEQTSETETKKKDQEDDDDVEDDAEYIRIPFLRNPYDDKHFDLTNPRVICAKTLRLVGPYLSKLDPILSESISILSFILEGNWSKASTSLENVVGNSRRLTNDFKDLAQHYIENLHDVESPPDDIKEALKDYIGKISSCEKSSSDFLEKYLETQTEGQESKDIDDLRNLLSTSSNLRSHYLKLRAEKEARDKLEAEIQAKKDELKAKEQYLYFFDNLKKTTLTRIEYK